MRYQLKAAHGGSLRRRRGAASRDVPAGGSPRFSLSRPLCFLVALCLSALPGCTSHLENLEKDTAWVDSREIVYFVGVPAEWLYSVRFDGTDLRRLSSGPILEYVLSADGHWIAAVLPGGKCEVIDVRSGEVTAVPGSCDSADWSPSGAALLITAGEHSISVYDREARSRREIVRPTSIFGGQARWSRQGDEFFYCEDIENAFYAVDPKSGSVRDLGRFKFGEQIRFEHEVIGAERLHFNQYDHVRESWDRRVSPSGRWRAVVKGGSLWISDTDGGNERLLLAETTLNWLKFEYPYGFWDPCWSADERYILGSSDEQLIILDAVTGRAGILAPGYRPLVWLPGYRPAVGEKTPLFLYSAIMSGY